ncbi:cytochrome C oxidase subunit IV family protein [Rhizorhabdus argentea]|uniref:cytochrome C oxidase subunit IV family protein n=1 Tax=Rhizorhabdus argentea TaxID=1387174 RepID=UPI0030ED73CD
MAILRSPLSIWVLLVALTLISYISWAESSVADARLAGTAVLLLAFLKARLIGLHYMELRDAVLPLRILFEAWVVVVCSTLVVMFWAAG